MSRKVCLVIALAATLIIQCGEEGSFNPVGPPQRLVSIAGLTVSPTRIPAGGAQANISGNVVDQFGEPFRDVVVEFSAAKGAITVADTTTSTGAFQAVYTSGEDPGIDTVIATVAGISNSITLEIAAPSPDITLRVGKTSFLANGIDTTLVAAEIAYRGGSITRVPILFETTAGAFNGQTSTFAYAVEGRATVVLTSPSSNQTLTATITATIAELSAGAIGNNNPFPPALTGYYPPKSNAPYSPFILSSASTSALALASTSALASASRDASEARIAVILRGVTIKVEAADTLIPGDGQAQTAIRAFIKEENLQAVPDAPVTFSARYGSIPVTALTNDAGLAQVMLTSAPMPGVADRIVAKYGPVIADSIMISYAPAVGYVVLTADQTSIRGDGLRGTQLSARVFGGTGRPTPNVQVRFSADDGSLPVSRARTDDNGIAAVQYIAPSAENDRRITIRAEVAGGSSAPTPIIPPDEMYVIYDDDDDGDDDKNIYSNSDISLYKTNEQNPNPKAQSLKPKTQSLKPNKTQSQDIISDSLTLTIRGVQMRVDAFPDRIVARRGATASISASVFETTSGNPISDDTVRFAATNGQILGFAPLNANGQATATFTSSGLTGQAVIIARYGAAHADTTFIELLPTIGNLSLTAERGSMLAGGIDTIRVMARITDALGAASPGAEVWFSLGPAPLDSSLAITAEDGKASLLVVSPSVESDTTLQANAGSAGLRRSISLVVRSIARRSSASPDSLSAGAATPVTIIFQAFEQTSRRPVSGDTVWFSAINGVVQPFSMLNANGVAQTNFTVGNAVGEAWVIGQLGELKPDSVRIILVEPLFDLVVRAGRRSLLANGEDTTRLAIHTVNILGHPTPEVWVQFNPENCQVTPLSVRTNNDGFAEATLYSAASHLDDTAIVRISAFHSLRMLEDTNDDDDDDDDDDKRYLIKFSKILGPPNRAEKESNSSLKGRLKSAPSSNAKTAEQFDFSHLTNTATSAARFDDKDLPVVKDFERKPSVSSLIQFDETDELVDSLKIGLRGVNLALRVSPRVLRADGRSRSGVNVQLSETTSGAAIAGARLRLGASLGAIPAVGETRPDGTYIDSLTAGVRPGMSIVRVMYGEGITALDSVEIVPDPARLNLTLSIDRLEAPADGRTQVNLSARVIDADGRPAAFVPVRFSLESPAAALIDPLEYVNVNRWENSFRLDDLEGLSGLQLQLQLRGVDNINTRVYINRQVIDNVALPQGRQWGEYTLALPAANLVQGVNRIEIISAIEQGLTDRFSIAGMRLSAVRSSLISLAGSDVDGNVSARWTTQRVAGITALRAALNDLSQRYVQRSVRLVAGGPAYIRISSAADTLLASGSETTDIFIIAADSAGNPVGDGHRIRLSAQPGGRIEPGEAATLGDGSVAAVYITPASDRDTICQITADCGDITNRIQFLLRGARLRLTVQDERLLADGNSQTTLRARLSTPDGGAVPGRRIDFASTRGSVEPFAITGNDGAASSRLIAGDAPDTARIIARFGADIRDSARVIFAPLIGSLELTSNTNSIRGDGLDTVGIVVEVTDGIGRGASGVRIDLEANLGTLRTRRLLTGNDGRASTLLTGSAVANDDSIRVVASSANGTHRDTLYIRLRGITFNLSVEPDSLPANGISTARASARLTETSSGNPVTAGRVTFSTDLGAIQSAAVVDDDGFAAVDYTAAPTIGLSTIRAFYGGGLQAATRLTLVDRAADMQMEISPPSLLANGVAVATVNVRILDPWGGAAPDEAVTIDFSAAGTVAPNIGFTGRNGLFSAAARGRPSLTDGRLTITASARDGRLRRTDAITLRGVTMDMTADTELIAGDGRSLATLTARVRETTAGHPVSDDTVRWTTTAGVIPPFSILDQNGETSVQLRSAAAPALAHVAAIYGSTIGGLTDSVVIAFASRYSYLRLAARQNSILADGVDSTQIVATLRDTLNRPVLGVRVFFNVLSGGTISADSVLTDGNGEAVVGARGTASSSDGWLRVRAAAGSLADTIVIAQRGITFTLSASPDSLPANGRSTAMITAQAQESTTGNPVVGRVVNFSTSAGVIPAAAVLNDEGFTMVSLRAPAVPARAGITATLGRTLTAVDSVEFVRTVGMLTLETDRPSLLADGLDSIAILGRLVDPVGNPAPGVRVALSAPDGGRLAPGIVHSDNDGLIRSTFYGFASTNDSVLSIEGMAAGGAAAATVVRLLGVRLQITASPNELSANGREPAVINVRLTETTRNTPLANRMLNFSADRGLIGWQAQTDSTGSASTVFTAPAAVGTAVITAEYGGLNADVNIACLTSTPAQAQLSVQPRSISVANVGRPETTTLTVVVQDARRQPVPDGSRITLRAQPAGMGITFSGGVDSLVGATEGGNIRTTVRAGDYSGSVHFTATYEGRLLAAGGNLSILAGPPAQATVRPDLWTIYRPGGGVTAFPVTAFVDDRFGNPVEDSTITHFYLNPDTLGQITGIGYTLGGIVLTPLNPIDYPTGVWLTYPNNHAGYPVWIRVISGNALDSTRVVLPGALQGGEPARMEIAIDSASLVADGNSAADITVRLLDREARPVADMTEVRLSARLGTVVSPRFSAAGEVSATYRSGRVAGIDTVRVSAGNVNDFVIIRLRSGRPAYIQLSAQRDTLRADSLDFTTITARLFDRFDNPVAAGYPVSFSASLGSITESAQTDAAGRAVARLTSARRTGVALIGAAAGEAYAQTAVLYVSGTANGIEFISGDRSAVGVRGSGSPETATLVFQVNDDRGAPIDSLHPAWVRFTLEGPSKTIDPDSSSADSVAFLQPDSVRTDAAGQVSAALRSGYFAGAVQITALTGANIHGRAIAIAIHGGPPDAAHFTVLPSRCSLTGIFGTPPDTTSIIVTLGDRFSNPVTPGTITRFSATGGVIEGSARTDSAGRASVRLITTLPWPVGGSDTITAQTIDWQNRTLSAQTGVFVTGPTIARFDTVNGWSIPFGSYRDFALTVADSFGHPLTAGTTVQISAAGQNPQGEEVEGLILSGDAVAEPVEITECEFRTTFYVRLFNYVSGLDRTEILLRAVITSDNGNREVISRGSGLSQSLSTQRSRVALSPPAIVADGVEESRVTITIYDVLGVAIKDVSPDRILISVVGANGIVTQPETPSDALGRITGIIVGRAVGEGRVQVRIMGQLLDEQPAIAFIPGPPASISALLGRRQLVVGGDTTRVVVSVVDENGNPAEDGAVVSFEAPDGAFNPAATTTIDGQAVTIFSSGITAGAAEFTARATRRGATVELTVQNIAFLPGPPARLAITAPSYNPTVGSQTELTLSALDAYGNIVAQNTPIALSVEPVGRGTVAPDTVLTDAEGGAQAIFSAGFVAGQTARVIATGGITTVRSSQFTFMPGPPGRVTLNVVPQAVEVGGSIDLTANILDAYNNPVSDTTQVTFSSNPEIGTLTPNIIRTSGGRAASVYSGVTQAGDVRVSAAAGGMSAATIVTFRVGALTSLSLQAVPQMVVVQRSTTITATAADRHGNRVAGATLDLAIIVNPGGGCSLQHNQRVTGDNGQAATVFTAGVTVGSAIITVTYDANGDGRPEAEASTFVDIAAQ